MVADVRFCDDGVDDWVWEGEVWRLGSTCMVGGIGRGFGKVRSMSLILEGAVAALLQFGFVVCIVNA